MGYFPDEQCSPLPLGVLGYPISSLCYTQLFCKAHILPSLGFSGRWMRHVAVQMGTGGAQETRGLSHPAWSRDPDLWHQV